MGAINIIRKAVSCSWNLCFESQICQDMIIILQGDLNRESLLLYSSQPDTNHSHQAD